jgi:hypothetical protein
LTLLTPSLPTQPTNFLIPLIILARRGLRPSVFKMMDVSRHKSMDTLRGYVRDAELFRDHAGAGLLWPAPRRGNLP